MVDIVFEPDVRFAAHRHARMYGAVTQYADSTQVAIPCEIRCGASAGPRLAVVAGVHGDELEGVRALQVLLADQAFFPAIGTLLLIPIAHPPAYTARTRRSPLDGLDLNRVFPGDPAGSITERIADYMCTRLLGGCDLVVSLHGLGVYGTLAPWMEFVDIPGEVGRRSHAAAQAFGIVDLMPLPLLPGVLLTALAERGIPAIEGEIGGQGMVIGSNWQRYVLGIKRVMQHLGMLGGTFETIKPRYWALSWQRAPVGGLFEPRVALGDQVERQQLLGTIFDPFGEPVAQLEALAAGTIGAVQTFATVVPAEQIALLWETTDVMHAAL